MASAFVMVFGSAIVFDRLAAAGRPNLSHLHFAGVGIGIAVSALLVSGLAAGNIGWSGHWIASGIISLAALIAVVVALGGLVGVIGGSVAAGRLGVVVLPSDEYWAICAENAASKPSKHPEQLPVTVKLPLIVTAPVSKFPLISGLLVLLFAIYSMFEPVSL